MAWFLILLIQLVTGLFLLGRYIQRRWNYWSDRGVDGPRHNLWRLLTRQESYGFTRGVYELKELDTKYGQVFGQVRLLTPALVVNDHRWIKQILVKDFHRFTDKPHMRTFDPMWNLNLFNVDGDGGWKRIRSITSPTFTSGKLRGMQPVMRRCVDDLLKYLDELTSSKDGKIATVDVKQLIVAFTIDVIAATSFATETRAIGAGLDSSPLVQHAVRLFRFQMWRILSTFAAPAWFNALFRIPHQFEPQHFDFFVELVREVVRRRRSGDGNKASPAHKHNDFVQLMMDAYVYESELKADNVQQLAADMEASEDSNIQQSQPQTGKKNTLTESEITAQCLIFFVAGFETTSATITYALFELARNPDIQDRLRAELTALELDSLDEEHHFEAVNAATYLDTVIKETLRKYPPFVRLERRLGGGGGNAEPYKIAGIPVEPDTIVQVSSYSVHHNPDYYPEPERFLPDRFAAANKHTLVPYTYLPFGVGPRNCVGMRFAYQEIKLLLAALVPRFRFTPAPDTPDRLGFKGGSLLLTALPFSLNVSPV